MNEALRSKPIPRIIICSLALLLVTSACALGAAVSPALLNHLIIGPDEIPWDAVLCYLETGPDAASEFAKSTAKFEEDWAGPPTGKPGCLKSSHYNVIVALAIMNSPEEAADAAARQASSCQMIIPEITGDESVRSFTDRAWYSCNPNFCGSLIFTRGNAIGDVHVTHKDGIDPRTLFDLAVRLSRKIDAASAGRPFPVPVLPPSLDDTKQSLEEAWAAKGFTGSLGKQRTTIALQNGKALPKLLPAKQVAKRDYLVPLSHLACILGAKAKPSVSERKAMVTLAGNRVVFTKGESRVQVGKRIVRLSRPVEFKSGQVFVPLSFVEKAFGSRIAWGKRGSMLVGKLTPGIGA